MTYQEDILYRDAVYVTYFRLFDEDGNAICEPPVYNGVCGEGLYLEFTMTIPSSWDHGEFYVKIVF